MSVADHRSAVPTTEPVDDAPVARADHRPAPAPTSAGSYRAPLRYSVAPPAVPVRRTSDQVLAIGFVVAVIACYAVEPIPTGEVHYPAWQAPIELATLCTVGAAAVVLWRGGRLAARLSLAAGALMAVMTMICPLAGHTPVGWWTWVQTGLSLAVMAAGAALHRRGQSRPV